MSAHEVTAEHVLALAKIPHDLEDSVISIYDETGRGYNDCGYVEVHRPEVAETRYMLLVPRQQVRLRVRVTGKDKDDKGATLAAWINAADVSETMDDNG